MGSKITRLVALFAVISVAGIAFVGFRYVGAGALVGLGPDTVVAHFRESGGIFPDAAVSYRGVEIGKVGTMRVSPVGVDVELKLDYSAPEVPANAVAVVTNRSAVGEQFVDLQPTADTTPYLADGSEIPADRTRTPVPVDTLLANLNSLATSVPLPELRTTVDELDKAFNRTGPDLQRLIDASNPLIRDAVANLPQMTQLLRDGRVVLNTQASLGPEITSFSRDLAVFTDQLRRDDPNLRNLLVQAPPAAAQLEGLIRDVGPDLGRVLANLLTVSQIVQPRLAGLEQILVTYPILAAAAPSVVPGDGFVHFGAVLNVNDPPPCRAGYMPVAQWLQANENLDNSAALNTSIRCQEAPPINVRGSQNAPAPSGAIGGTSNPGASPATSPTQNQPPPPNPTSATPTVPANGSMASGNGLPPIILSGMS